MTATVEHPQVRQDGAMAAEAQDLPELTFVEPMAGFPQYVRFALVDVDGSGVLHALRSLDEPALRFLVIPPGSFFPDYAPEIDDAWAERLGLTDAADAQVLLVVTVGDTPRDATVNLLAPIVVNLRARTAAQIVLHGDLPLRAPLAPAA